MVVIGNGFGRPATIVKSARQNPASIANARKARKNFPKKMADNAKVPSIIDMEMLELIFEILTIIADNNTTEGKYDPADSIIKNWRNNKKEKYRISHYYLLNLFCKKDVIIQNY